MWGMIWPPSPSPHPQQHYGRVHILQTNGICLQIIRYVGTKFTLLPCRRNWGVAQKGGSWYCHRKGVESWGDGIILVGIPTLHSQNVYSCRGRWWGKFNYGRCRWGRFVRCCWGRSISVRCCWGRFIRGRCCWCRFIRGRFIRGRCCWRRFIRGRCCWRSFIRGRCYLCKSRHCVCLGAGWMLCVLRMRSRTMITSGVSSTRPHETKKDKNAYSN